jgi:hypothetical protein
VFLKYFLIHYACRYISVFLNEADFLEKSLGLIMEVLEIILSVQRQHIYLEVNMFCFVFSTIFVLLYILLIFFSIFDQLEYIYGR